MPADALKQRATIAEREAAALQRRLVKADAHYREQLAASEAASNSNHDLQRRMLEAKEVRALGALVLVLLLSPTRPDPNP